MTPEIKAWAVKHGVSDEAIRDLMKNFIPSGPLPEGKKGYSETAVQSRARIAASQQGMILMRNNSGVLKDDGGQPVRFGLANDSKRVNEEIKSSDLIGIRPILIGPEHLGTVIGRFVAIECKEAKWKWTGKGREVAQAKFHTIVVKHGGEARFITSEYQI